MNRQEVIMLAAIFGLYISIGSFAAAEGLLGVIFYAVSCILTVVCVIIGISFL